MNNINIYINKKTRQVNLSKSVIGNDGENLQENLVFLFDEFVNGTARLEITKQNVAPSYIMLTKVDNTYQLPIKSIITKAGRINMQLVITEGTNDEEIPIFKSNEFYMIVNSSINAEIEESEEYPEWIDVANTKLNEFDNLDISASKSGTTATITITDKDGNETSVNIYDGQQGQPGQNGRDGIDGKDGTNGITPTIGDNGNWYLGSTDTGKPSRGLQGETGATGQNGRDGYMQYTAGNNITIENGVISATGGGNYQPLINNDNKLSADLVDDTETTNKFFSGKYNDLTNKPDIYKIETLSSKYLYFDTMTKGLYYDLNYLSKNISYKIKTSDGSFKTLTLETGTDYIYKIVIIKNQDEITNTGTPYDRIFGYIYYRKENGENRYASLYYDYVNNVMTNVYTYSTSRECDVLSRNAQSFIGVKTFNSIPKLNSYSAPSNDTDLVAKKYVDDKIGNINTILATLTTPSNNS